MKLKFDVTHQEYKIISDILKKYLPSNCKVWVFGSRAKNQARFNSDLDLALQIKDQKKIDKKIILQLKEDFNDAPIAYEVDIIDLNEIEENFKNVIVSDLVDFGLRNSGKVPKIRFPEFSGEWARKKLSDVAIKKSSNISANKIEENYGEYFIYGASGIFKKVDFYEEENDYISIVKDGAGVGRTLYCKGKSSVLGTLEIIKPRDNLNAYFLYCLLKNISFTKYVTGSTIPHIYFKDYSTEACQVPTLPEQQKIANFLTTIDKRIEKLIDKKSLLENYKKGVMQKIFSRQIRFKDDNGDDYPAWEEKKLSDVAIKKSSNISANKIEENYGEYFIYGASGIFKKVDFYEEESDYISIVKDGAGVGRTLYCKGKSSVLGTLEIIKPRDNLNAYFLYCLLKNISFTKYVTGSTIPHIYFKDYSTEACQVPTLPEQQKIANFLTTFDKKIENIQAQISESKTFKKGLLQQMFV